MLAAAAQLGYSTAEDAASTTPVCRPPPTAFRRGDGAKLLAKPQLSTTTIARLLHARSEMNKPWKDRGGGEKAEDQKKEVEGKGGKRLLLTRVAGCALSS